VRVHENPRVFHFFLDEYDRIYAAQYGGDVAGELSALYRSGDDGKTWTNIWSAPVIGAVKQHIHFAGLSPLSKGRGILQTGDTEQRLYWTEDYFSTLSYYALCEEFLFGAVGSNVAMGGSNMYYLSDLAAGRYSYDYMRGNVFLPSPSRDENWPTPGVAHFRHTADFDPVTGWLFLLGGDDAVGGFYSDDMGATWGKLPLGDIPTGAVKTLPGRYVYVMSRMPIVRLLRLPYPKPPQPLPYVRVVYGSGDPTAPIWRPGDSSTPPIPIGKYSKVGVWVKVNAATDVIVWEVLRGHATAWAKRVDTISFAAAGEEYRVYDVRGTFLRIVNTAGVSIALHLNYIP